MRSVARNRAEATSAKSIRRLTERLCATTRTTAMSRHGLIRGRISLRPFTRKRWSSSMFTRRNGATSSDEADPAYLEAEEREQRRKDGPVLHGRRESGHVDAGNV